MAYKLPIPTLRETNYTEINSDLAAGLHKLLRNHMRYPYQNCLNCTQWDFGKDECGKYKSKPPTEVIVYSCPDYVDNEGIPF
jgi:hypothetical protein